MNILLIHQNFVDPDHPGGTRHFELATQLTRRGHRVTIVAGSVDYLSGKRITGTRWGIARDSIDGVRILRAYAHPSIHRSLLWRAFSFLTFTVSSFWAGLLAGPVDIVIGTSPPIFQLASAWGVSLVRRRPFVLEVRDLWPEFAIDMGILKNPTIIAIARWFEGFFYARARHIVVNSPAYRDYLSKKGVSTNRISVVPNGVDWRMFASSTSGGTIRDEFKLDRKFVVTYAGALGPANDIPTILRAAQRINDREDVHFLLLGGGKDQGHLQQLAKTLELRNVTFAGCVPKRRMQEVLATSDACVATLQDIPMFGTTYPNKVFDYMASGKPTILGIRGVIQDVVESAQGGICIPPGDDGALADGVCWLKNHPHECRQMGMSAREYVKEHFDRHQQTVELERLLQTIQQARSSWYGTFFKRLLDLSVALFGCLILSPLFVVLALLVRLGMGSPVLFRQQRAGLHSRIFTIYKFRTMKDARDTDGNLLGDELRMTRLGSILRSLSLDELPQLLNVIRGDMSLIGPRPLLVKYLDRYNPHQARRHDVRPGITGWAQVNGRNAVSWQRRFDLDVWYVDHVSLWLDVKILWLTVRQVLRRKGVSEENHVTMSEFMGNDPETASVEGSRSD